MKLLIVAVISILGCSVSGKSIKEASKVPNKIVVISRVCTYNGRDYLEGEEIIATRRFCLSCNCSKDFKEPNSAACDVIECKDIEPLQRGCLPVYNDIDCCPVDWNCNDARSLQSKCEKRYLKHYEVKGCTPVLESGSNCPVRYNCPDQQVQNNNTVCVYRGRSYKKKDEINIGNPCEICTCEQSYATDGLEISCISIECPEFFSPPLNDSCRRIYETGKCCPVRTQCSNDQVSPKTEKVCDYNGKVYRSGDRIYPEDNPCLVCTCDEQWSGIHGNSCRLHDCSLELKKKQISKGCLPIYHEATCCPIEFHCGTPEEGFTNSTVPFVSKEDSESENFCVFKGSRYGLGQTLDINHPTNCVTCICTTPPDFTCVHKTCPRPPNDDYENCESAYVPGQCCPTYNCKQASVEAPIPPSMCSPVVCPTVCSEVTIHNSCPFCMCQEKLCAPPKCDDDCVVQKDVPEGQCPGCECPGRNPAALFCSPVRCRENCHEVVSAMGCPVCVCGPLCTPPKCQPGCIIDREVADGECPKCYCPADDTKTVMCSPVRCPVGCMETVGNSGCPSCDCRPLCAPPKCDEGCYLNPFPTGPCPECVCDYKESVPQLLCSPVKCGPLCHEAYDGEGCPTCICDPLCTPPICERNCHLEYNSQDGPCPSCVCNKDPVLCPSVSCGQMCEKTLGPDGCPACSCSPLCSRPKCEPGCVLEYDRASGPCPSCVCPVAEMQCAPVKCDGSCLVAVGDNGCPTCICNTQCSIPKCESGCELRYSEKEGACPSCQCAFNYGLQCTPPKCGPGCRVNSETKPCPSCVCISQAGIPVVQCTLPKCTPGCQIDYSAKPCPSCNCPQMQPAVLQCSPPKCESGCQTDYSTSPCPSCNCGDSSLIQCSPPDCNAPCQVDYNTKPCPSCACGQSIVPSIECSPVKCEPHCQIDYNTKPCPTCSCTSQNIPIIQCSSTKCDPGCHIDYDAKPCPSCICQVGIPMIHCSPPKCNAGCEIDFSAKPCPSCKCGIQNIPLCSLSKCDSGCQIDYNARPCPICICGTQDLSPPLCSPPKCESGCNIDYNVEPCPTCLCSPATDHVLCSLPKCELGCVVDYNTKPCPTCDCSKAPGVSPVLCSPPKCESGCVVNYNSKPCPSCDCSTAPVSVQCSTVKCDAGCEVNYSSKPCPTCRCGFQCSPVRCGPGCQIDFNSRPCPTCKCNTFSKLQCSPLRCPPECHTDYSVQPCPRCACDTPEIPAIMCSPPKCDEPGCSLDYSAKPCPSCKCGNQGGLPTVQCSLPKCDPGCQIDYSTTPCPSCSCDAPIGGVCSAVKCDPGCDEVVGESGCPTCHCRSLCSIPKCVVGCHVDYNAEPCPTCICDRHQRKSGVLNPYNVFVSDVACRQTKCGFGCEMEREASGTERCPMCLCSGKTGEKIKCLAMHCELPCRFERFSPYGCPTCICHPIPCPQIKCGPTTIEEKLPEDRCPKCVINKGS